ncbi:MAG: choice-of-anchor J domain-containing protein [Ferruginibacter sp.]
MKKLLVILTLTFYAFIAKCQVLTESFDGTTFPPAGWVTNIVSVGDGSQGYPGGPWSRSTGDVNTATTINPHSGAGMAYYDSWDFDPTSQADLITPAMNFSGAAKRVSFWMFRSGTYSGKDSLTVYVNTAAGTAGATYLGKIIRVYTSAPIESAVGWYQYYFDIPASYNGATNYIIFRGTGDYGESICLDDVVVADQPSCITPTGLNVSNYNYGAGTGTATWTAPPGSPTGYQWAINITGVAPASGTAVATTSAAITGITADTVDYLYVRTACSGSTFSTWASFSFAALPCAIITAPLNGATGVPASQTFTWTAVPHATAYDFYLGTAAGSETNIGTVTGTTATISNLTPGTTYYWFIVPKIGAVSALKSTCASNSFTIAAEPNTPVNNVCSGAININSSNVAGNAVAGTTVGATLTLPANACAGFTGVADDDVWFEFTTTSSAPAGTLTITPDAVGGISDIVAQVYQATSCASLGTPVTCADGTGGTSPEVVNLSALTPNKHYFMRVYSYGSGAANQGSFTIVASLTSTIPVTLESFTAQRAGRINILNWSTAQEINSSYYVIERSSDARNYVSIGQVTAAGNSSSVTNYLFTDNNPPAGINYYRLRLVDKDNTNKYSVVRSVRNEGIADIAIYPNPVNDQLKVSINADKAGTGSFVITDISGKIIYTKTLSIARGSNLLPVNTGNFAAGAYIIKIQLDDDVLVRKFNKL